MAFCDITLAGHSS